MTRRSDRLIHHALLLATPLLVAIGCASAPRTGGGASAPSAAAGSGASDSKAPPSFVKTNDTTKMVALLDLRTDLPKDTLWRVVTAALDRRYKLQVQDRTAGVAQTTWQSPKDSDGIPDLRYRMRVSVRFIGTDWRRLEVRCEANWKTQETGFDRVLLAEAIADLKTRVGRG
jgi:hypothetical protein